MDLVREFELINDITDKKDFWKLAVKVKDKWNVMANGKHHFEMLIVDAKGADIQVIIPSNFKTDYDKMVENKNYTITNFEVLKNDAMFKAINHKYKLIWTGGTSVEEGTNHQIPEVVPKFKPFSDIVAGKWRADLLVDVIGAVVQMGYQQLEKSKKIQVNFLMTDLSNQTINCTLWEEYAAKFIKFNQERKDTGPIVVMIKYGKFPLTVSNTYNLTKLFINEDVPEITNFMKLLTQNQQIEPMNQIERIKISMIGNPSKLPKSLQRMITSVEESTKNHSRLQLVAAINYGGKYDVVQACKSVAKKVQDGLIHLEDINENIIEKELETKCTEFPYPDLLLRTSGELRVSNFLLWQLAFTELFFNQKLWPDFGKDEFEEALSLFQKRQRRYGGRH